MDLLKQCQQWFEQDEAQKVIDLSLIHIYITLMSSKPEQVLPVLEQCSIKVDLL